MTPSTMIIGWVLPRKLVGLRSWIDRSPPGAAPGRIVAPATFPERLARTSPVGATGILSGVTRAREKGAFAPAIGSVTPVVTTVESTRVRSSRAKFCVVTWPAATRMSSTRFGASPMRAASIE
jgi:hypothetical protein